MLNPSMKGALAEQMIVAEAIRAGVFVLRPIAEGARYDLMFDVDGLLRRVQVKSAARKGDVIVVGTRTCRYTPRGYVRTTYDASEIDAIAVYCQDTNGCYYIPIADVRGRSMIHLRLAKARNNQEFAISYAADYDFRGAIAQLGERLTGSQEAGGSSPPSSTPLKAVP
jgi:PD-(D/E)XK nuclease superfamily protein